MKNGAVIEIRNVEDASIDTDRRPVLAVRPDGANYLWRKNPSRELSIDLWAMGCWHTSATRRSLLSGGNAGLALLANAIATAAG
jgi:hypothetical protein